MAYAPGAIEVLSYRRMSISVIGFGGRQRAIYLLASLLIGLMEGCQNSGQAIESSGRMQRLQVIIG